MKKFLKILKNKETQEALLELYINIRSGLIYDDIGTKYLLCIDKEGEVFAIPFLVNRPKIEEGTMIVLTIDEEVIEFPKKRLGDIKEKVEDLDDFLEHLEKHGKDKSYISWDEYKLFNYDNFESICATVWYDICLETCEDILKKAISDMIYLIEVTER